MDRQIGTGGFAEVMRAVHKNSKRVCAIKQISKEKNQKSNIMREVKAGLMLTHKNIVKYIENCDDEDNEYVIFEYVRGMKVISLRNY